MSSFTGSFNPNPTKKSSRKKSVKSSSSPPEFGVCLVGSSGGGAATLGHTDAVSLLQTIHGELLKIQGCMGIVSALYVSCDSGRGLDQVNPSKERVTLYRASQRSHGSSSSSISNNRILLVEPIQSGTLERVNNYVRRLDKEMAQLLSTGTTNNNNNSNNNNGKQQQQQTPLHYSPSTQTSTSSASPTYNVKGLICVSCHVELFFETFTAAARLNLPVTGSGGTSLSEASAQYGIRLVGNAGGSVATTTYTRAISFAHAMARDWKRPYSTFSSGSHSNNTNIRPQWTSVLDACLPAFWGVCLAIHILEQFVSISLASDEEQGQQEETTINDATKFTRFLVSLVKEYVPPSLFMLFPPHWVRHLILLQEWIRDDLLTSLRWYALPLTCSVVMASSLAPQYGSTVIMAACMASVVCRESILAGLLVGYLVASMVARLTVWCISWSVPATATNLWVGGMAGILAALFVGPLVPALQLITHWIRWVIHEGLGGVGVDGGVLWSHHNGSIPGVGFLVGVLFCHGSKMGLYHSLFLPLVLIEMERGDASLLGTIDEATLVLVSAGICAANLLFHPYCSRYESQLCWRGLRINVLFGDFIEVAYPFMERSGMVNIVGYLASGLATELLLAKNTRDCMSLAYLPVPMSIWLANDWHQVSLAYITAFGTSFLGTLYNNLMYAEERKNLVMEEETRDKFE